MTSKNTKSGSGLSLGDKFEGVAPAGAAAVDVSASPTAKAFDPANQMILVGLVQLNKVSSYLKDLPDEAKAEFLVAPKSTATLFGGSPGNPAPGKLSNLGTRYEDGESINMIDESYGLNFSGQALVGKNSSIYDGEKGWASGVRAAWEQAKTSGHDVMTGLTIGTRQLVFGRKYSATAVTVENNLYARVDDINAAIAMQGGEQIVTSGEGPEGDHWQLTSGDYGSSQVDIINFSNGKKDWTYTVDGYLAAGETRYASSRPVALNVIGLNL